MRPTGSQVLPTLPIMVPSSLMTQTILGPWWVEVEVGVAPHADAETGLGSGPGGALRVDHLLDHYPLHVNTSTQQHINRYI